MEYFELISSWTEGMSRLMMVIKEMQNSQNRMKGGENYARR